MPNGNSSQAPPALVLLSGLPASGKTTFAHALRAVLEAEHIESDAIRRSLYARPAYTIEENGRVFALAERRAAAALRASRHAIVDATNLTRSDRRRFARLAEQCGASLVAVRLTAPEEEIRGRLAAPRAGHSQAGMAVYEMMRDRAEPFTSPAIVVDTRFGLAASIALALRLVQK